MRVVVRACLALIVGVSPAGARDRTRCRVLCTPEFNVEPTITFSNLSGSPHITSDDGTVTRELRETEFEVILSLALPTRMPWLECTIEAIFLPFNRDSTPELEFESNLVWLPGERMQGCVSAHVDVVDKFSAAERPTARRACTHKLNLELDTSVSIFDWLPEGRRLRGVGLEGSLDYGRQGPELATASTATVISRTRAHGHSQLCSSYP